MTENEEPVPQTPQPAPQPVFHQMSPATRPVPPKGMLVGQMIAGVLTMVSAIITLVLTILKLAGTESFMNVFWWVTFAFMIIDVIFSFMTTGKKYRATKSSIIASFLGLGGIIILLISTFLN